MSSAGRAVSSNGCVTKPKEREIGLTGCAVSIRSSSLTGSYVMETAEHREPYESRGSRTVLGAPGDETPPGDSTKAALPTTRPARPDSPRFRTRSNKRQHSSFGPTNPEPQAFVPTLTSPVAPSVRFLCSRSPDSSAFAAEQSRRHVTPEGA